MISFVTPTDQEKIVRIPYMQSEQTSSFSRTKSGSQEKILGRKRINHAVSTHAVVKRRTRHDLFLSRSQAAKLIKPDSETSLQHDDQ